MKQVYLYHDTMIGIYSAFYDAWKESRNKNVGIALWGRTDQELFCEYHEVDESRKKEQAIEKMMRKNLGAEAYRQIYYALLSDDAHKAEAVFKVLQEARELRDSTRIMEHLSSENVAKVFALGRSVANEAHLFTEFIRFRELEGGILFSEITPKNQVLTCIGDHFSDRFPLENFMIYDKTHQVCLVHRTGDIWRLVWGKSVNTQASQRVSGAELEYQRLWKNFFSSIAIEERRNPTCQRTHLPLRYRGDMVEFEEKRKEKFNGLSL